MHFLVCHAVTTANDAISNLNLTVALILKFHTHGKEVINPTNVEVIRNDLTLSLTERLIVSSFIRLA